MDITVQRILSLIPKKEDGKYVYGAKKKFAESIGYVGGEIVTMWESGSSKSYMGKLYEISAVYNVSVEWLRGETDDPAPAGQKEKPTPVSEDGLDAELVALIKRIPSDRMPEVERYLRFQAESEEKP